MFAFQTLPALAIVVATLTAFFLGFLWYYKLFAKPWMAAMGLKRDDIDGAGVNIGAALGSSVAASFLSMLGLALVLQLLPAPHLGAALIAALVVWLAFAMTPLLKLIFWEDRPLNLVLIDGGYELSSLLSGAIILTYLPY